MQKISFQISVILLLVVMTFSFCTSSRNSGKDGKDYRIGFYNVENLFDTKDDPKIKDEEFMPNSKKKWTEERYQIKLDHLAKVISSMGTPTILGLCEVENKGVIEDLIQTKALKKANYGIAHRDSPDVRGIDVAMIYQKKHFEVLSIETIVINFPEHIVKNYSTRDILVVKGIFAGKDTMHIFINHWPSRRGGLEKSSPKREFVAAELLKKVNKVKANNPMANILIMGDFNDETDNKSIVSVLGAKGSLSRSKSLHNCMADLDKAGKGTYNYKGNWNMLDQIIVSPHMVTNKKGLRVTDVVLHREEWMMYQDKRNGATPSRTYGGPNYYGGYSDHLPVYVKVKK